MVLTVRSKILLTVLSVVMLFALFILFYYPARQTAYLLENYNDQVENLAKTVALGVRIALNEENFEGVETAIDFVRNDDRLHFVSIIQIDTIWKADHTHFKVDKKIFSTSPENVSVDPDAISDQHSINKSAPFTSKIMNGEIMVSFTTIEIEQGKKQIRLASAAASLTVFIIGLFIGYWLAGNISRPVLALRDAAHKVGEGDLTQMVKNKSRDEIGELSVAFNKMVRDLGMARSEVHERTKELTLEKEKSDKLLLNILPSETAEELKNTGTAQAKHYDSVTVLFTDFKDFTPISGTMTANKLVTELHDCFSRFDHIIRKYNIEKIKTIGDAYMCVAGLPVKNDTHPFDAVNAAIEIRDCMLAYNKEKSARGEYGFDVRIGIHPGPVVAGIVGVHKFAYDIWGSTVNTAARLEQNSEPNMINISSALYDIIKGTYDCTPRGNILVKGIGEIPMYFVRGIKKKFTESF